MRPRPASCVFLQRSVFKQLRASVSLGDATITWSDSMKILGVTLDSNCSFQSHVKNLRSKIRARTWALSKLRKAGLDEKRLVCTYKTLLCPAVEYAVPVWHSMLTAEQSSELERQRTQALRNIFGPEGSARSLRDRAELETLAKRRESMCLKCANNCFRCKN